MQVASSQSVTARLTFRFRDGSLHDETAVYAQRGHFRLLNYHLVQRGPAFPRTLEMSIDATTGQVDVSHTDGDGERKTEAERMELPDDLANGVVAPLIGKQPPDSHVWIFGGAAPAFVRAEQTLFVGGPSYRIELTSPAWPRPAAASTY